MAKKKIKFSLVYRDMWQSSGKFQPRKDQLERIAPAIIDMGCFARVETNGGAFEQVNLMAGENPNLAVRAFCKPFNEVGIQTVMTDTTSQLRYYTLDGRFAGNDLNLLRKGIYLVSGRAVVVR